MRTPRSRHLLAPKAGRRRDLPDAVGRPQREPLRQRKPAALRYFNVAGAYERHGERHAPISNVLEIAPGDGSVMKLFDDDYPTSDGRAERHPSGRA
ncbi:hypothetical protein [Actinomadura sp. GTD37]|uniref:hypothetical protein n=1 Tax=Actinomadura sp. GTD37 TaxID=1778030 RepID=UPI0035BFDADA